MLLSYGLVPSFLTPRGNLGLQLSPSSISTCIPSLGCAETSGAQVNPHSSLLCQHLCSSWREGLLLQRMTVVASGNPSFWNNRPTAEPSSCFFHPNMCEWQSCSLLLGFLTPVTPPNPKYSCCHGYPSLFREDAHLSNNFNKGKASFWVWLPGEAWQVAGGSDAQGSLAVQWCLAHLAVPLVLCLLPAVLWGQTWGSGLCPCTCCVTLIPASSPAPGPAFSAGDFIVSAAPLAAGDGALELSPGWIPAWI